MWSLQHIIFIWRRRYWDFQICISVPLTIISLPLTQITLYQKSSKRDHEDFIDYISVFHLNIQIHGRNFESFKELKKLLSIKFSVILFSENMVVWWKYTQKLTFSITRLQLPVSKYKKRKDLSMNYESLEILSFMYQLKPHRENLKTIFHFRYWSNLGIENCFSFFSLTNYCKFEVTLELMDSEKSDWKIESNQLKFAR